MGDSLKAFYKYSLDVYLPKLIHSHLIQRRLKSHMEVRADFKIMPSEMAVAISGRGWIILLQKGNNEEPVHLSLKLPLLPKVEKGHWSHFYLVSFAESCSCLSSRTLNVERFMSSISSDLPNLIFLSSRMMKMLNFYEFYLVSSAKSCSCCRRPRSFSLEKQPATPCQVLDLQLVVCGGTRCWYPPTCGRTSCGISYLFECVVWVWEL